MTLALVLAGVALTLACAVILLLKGRRLVLLLGLTGVVPALWLAPFLVAHPESWWARRFYAEAKLREAIAREARRRESWAE